MPFRRHTKPRHSGSVSRNLPGAAVANRNRIDVLARRQHGLVTWAQLRRREMAKAAIHRAVAAGQLSRVYPGVYSVVAPVLMTEVARLAAAILAGGPGACLCGPSAAWWLRLMARPDAIHVAVAGRRAALPGIRWHRRSLAAHDRLLVRGLPVTAPARVPSDLAADMSVWELKGVLAELEFHHGIAAADVIVRPGVAGTAKLRQAIADHAPVLAQTREELERRSAEFLVARGFLLPRFNHPIGKSTVDAVYEEQRVVIELDGVRGHAGERRILRDHRRDLHRRADGFTVLRYHFTQITSPADQALIEAELTRLGIPRVGDELGY